MWSETPLDATRSEIYDESILYPYAWKISFSILSTGCLFILNPDIERLFGLKKFRVCFSILDGSEITGMIVHLVVCEYLKKSTYIKVNINRFSSQNKLLICFGDNYGIFWKMDKR